MSENMRTIDKDLPPKHKAQSGFVLNGLFLLRSTAGICLSILVMGQMNLATAGELSPFSVKLGAGVVAKPDYVGSDDYKIRTMPIASVTWDVGTQKPTDGKNIQLGLHDVTLKFPGVLDIGVVRMYRPEGLYKLNIGAAYNKGRDQDDNVALNGMGNIDGHMLAKVGFHFKAKGPGVRINLGFSKDHSNDSNGATLDGEIGYLQPLARKVFITPFAAFSWADSDHMQRYFGVTAAQAQNSGNAEFAATSGLKSAGLGLKAGWKISENWTLNSTLGYTQLLNDAADSPLVKTEGSPDQMFAKAAIVYAF